MGFTALIGGPEIDVPAGYNQIVYEPQYVLSADKKQYVEITGSVKSMLPNPMPISLMFWAAPGNEPALIKVASAYEAATHHRVPPRVIRTGRGRAVSNRSRLAELKEKFLSNKSWTEKDALATPASACSVV